MARPKNLVSTETWEFTTTRWISEALDELVRRGYHGSSRSEAAHRLLAERLQAEEEAGRLSEMAKKRGIQQEMSRFIKTD